MKVRTMRVEFKECGTKYDGERYSIEVRPGPADFIEVEQGGDYLQLTVAEATRLSEILSLLVTEKTETDQ
jgi:predicted RecB family endonuclease